MAENPTPLPPEPETASEPAGAPVKSRMLPVAETDRIVAIDVLRGFALLGILIMNIQSFAMIEAAYFFPTSFGDLTGANLGVWWLSDLLANRKFMTLFSLLFGAGVLLQTQRADAEGRSFRGIYYRRIFWLWIFGLIHSYIFWVGDILVTYAVAAVFLYPMRKIGPGKLLTIALIVLAVGSGLSVMSGLTAESWDTNGEFAGDWFPSEHDIDEELTAMRGSWLDEIRHRAPNTLELHIWVIPFHLFWRGLGVMLMGMALYKWGLLAAGRRRAFNMWMVLGLLVGLPLTAYGAWRSFASDWEPVSAFFLDAQFGYWGSLLIALGWAGLVFTVINRGWLAGLQRRLAAVGRTAFSNYLLQTLICTTLFYGRGFGLFGSVSRVGQLGIVVAIWVLQLWLAPLWLKRFRYGPMEWLWRTLAYLKRPVMRR